MSWFSGFKSFVGLGRPKEEQQAQSQEPQEMYDKQSVDETLRNLLEAHIKETDPIKKKEKEIKYTEFHCKSGSLSALQKQICEQELKRLQDELRRMPIPDWEQAGQAGEHNDEDDAGIFSGFGGKMKSKRTKSKRTKSKRTKSKRTKSKRTKSKRTKSKRTKSKRTKK